MNSRVQSWLSAHLPAWAEAADRWVQRESFTLGGAQPTVEERELVALVAAAEAGATVAMVRQLLGSRAALGARGWRHGGSARSLSRLLDAEISQPLKDQLSAEDPAARYAAEARACAYLLGSLRWAALAHQNLGKGKGKAGS